MNADTDRTMRIRITRDRAGQHTVSDVGRLASTVGYWTGMAGMLLLGMLVPVAVELSTPLQPTQVTFDLLRAATLGGLVVSAFCWFIHYEANNVVQQLKKTADGNHSAVEQAADRNRNATEDVKHRIGDLCQVVAVGQEHVYGMAQEALRANRDMRVQVANQTDELERLRATVHELVAGQSDVLVEQTQVLRQIERRLTVDLDPEVVDNVRSIARKLME